MKLFILYLISLVSRGDLLTSELGTIENVNKIRRHRGHRSLIYENGGALKFSIGPSMQVDLGDPISWRSMVCSFTLQGGDYRLPTEPTYPWDKWEDTFARSLKQMKLKYERYGEYQDDESREFVYNLLEGYMNRYKADGHQCLLRAICENAQVWRHEGVFAQVLNVVLTPGKEKLDKSYTMALLAGRHGADCIKLYYLCPKGKSLLDQYIDDIY